MLYLRYFRVCQHSAFTDVDLTQPSEPRKLEKTVDAIRDQYEIALTSSAVSHLGNAQRQSGVKDTIAEPIIARIQARVAELHIPSADGSRLPMSQITPIVRAELENSGTQLQMNPLLDMPGK
jgi:hypothetical protein